VIRSAKARVSRPNTRFHSDPPGYSDQLNTMNDYQRTARVHVNPNRRYWRAFASIATVIAFAAALAAVATPVSAEASSRERVAAFDGTREYIVLYRSRVSLGARLRTEARKGNEVEARYTSSINGALLELGADDVNRLREDDRVLSVTRDRRVSINVQERLRRSASWGLDRVNQRNLPLDGLSGMMRSGAGVEAYVIDTGIRSTHTDLAGRVNPEGFSAYGSTEDCNGHGTHVAGTVAGSRYGVAPGASVTAIRVLDCEGSGWSSDVLAGIDWMIRDHLSDAAAGSGRSDSPQVERTAKDSGKSETGKVVEKKDSLPGNAGRSTKKEEEVSTSSYGSGWVRDLRPSPYGSTYDFRVSATVNSNICSPSGACAWFPLLTVFPEATQCNSSGAGGNIAWIGSVQQRVGTQTANAYDEYMPDTIPWRFCLYAYGHAGYRLLHQEVLSPPASTRPANDDFTARQALTSLGAVSGTTVNATAESGEQGHYNSRAYSSIWYRWTAPANGNLVITTAGSSFDTTLAIYTGSSLGSLTQLAENDDAEGSRTSRIAVPVTSGTSYSFAIDGFSGATGSTRIAGTFTEGGGETPGDPGNPGDPGAPPPPFRSAVANMSLGGIRTEAKNIAVQRAIDAGITVVVAAGNDNDDACRYSPASAPNAITVGSSNSSDARSYFSNTGSCVDLFAPGEEIASAWHESNSASKVISGTSMASPHVAGAAAQLLGQDRSMTPAAVARELTETATRDLVTDAGQNSPNLLLNVPAEAGALISAPEGDVLTSSRNNTATVSISGSEGGSLECSINGTAWQACQPGVTRYPGLGLGSHEFRLRGTVEGRSIPETTRTWRYVPAAPVITRGPRRGTSRKALFRFQKIKGLKAQCKLDRRPWRNCRSPKRYRGLRPGRHTFRVRQISGDLISPVESKTWRILKRKGSRR
jgi:subtilisin family serine protease